MVARQRRDLHRVYEDRPEGSQRRPEKGRRDHPVASLSAIRGSHTGHMSRGHPVSSGQSAGPSGDHTPCSRLNKPHVDEHLPRTKSTL